MVRRGWTCQVTCSVTGLQSFTEYQAMHLNILEQASNAELNVARFAKSYGHIALPDMHEDQRSLGGSFKQVPLAWTQNWLLELLELLELVSGSSQGTMYELHLRQRLGLL